MYEKLDIEKEIINVIKEDKRVLLLIHDAKNEVYSDWVLRNSNVCSMDKMDKSVQRELRISTLLHPDKIYHFDLTSVITDKEDDDILSHSGSMSRALKINKFISNTFKGGRNNPIILSSFIYISLSTTYSDDLMTKHIIGGTRPIMDSDFVIEFEKEEIEDKTYIIANIHKSRFPRNGKYDVTDYFKPLLREWKISSIGI